MKLNTYHCLTIKPGEVLEREDLDRLVLFLRTRTQLLVDVTKQGNIIFTEEKKDGYEEKAGAKARQGKPKAKDKVDHRKR